MFSHERLESTGNDLLSRGKHYHRLWMLNGRVRNGNGCVHTDIITGKSHARITSPEVDRNGNTAYIDNNVGVKKVLNHL